MSVFVCVTECCVSACDVFRRVWESCLLKYNGNYKEHQWAYLRTEEGVGLVERVECEAEGEPE